MSFIPNNEVPSNSNSNSNSQSREQPSADLMADMLREAIQAGENPKLKVISNSMAPLIMKDDLVILEAIDLETLKKGDIITLLDQQTFLTHRVVLIKNKSIATRGDSNLVNDPLYRQNQMIGRVVKIKSLYFGKTIDLNSYAGQTINNLTWGGSTAIATVTTPYNNGNFFKVLNVLFNAVMRLLVKILINTT